MKKRNPKHFTTKHTHIRRKQPVAQRVIQKGEFEIGIMCIIEFEDYQTPFRMTIDKSVFNEIPAGFDDNDIRQDIGSLYQKFANYDTSDQILGASNKEQLQSQLMIAITYYARNIFEKNQKNIKALKLIECSMGITFGFKINMINALEFQMGETIEYLFNDFETWKTNTQQIVDDLNG